MQKIDYQRVQHIIWDWNGTLLDDLKICVDIINTILIERGLTKRTPAEYREVFGFPVKDYYQRLGIDFDHEPFETISTLFITTYEQRRKTCNLMAGTPATLVEISEMGITQSILSASKKSYLDQAIIDYDIKQYFILVDGLENHHAAGKKDLAEKHLASLPYSADQILLVGDTVHDAEIAKHLQAQCCLIPKGHHSRNKLINTGCHLEASITNLSKKLAAN